MLELRFTEQQALLQELSDALYAQQKELDTLKAQVSLINRRLQAEPGLVVATEKERPPHY